MRYFRPIGFSLVLFLFFTAFIFSQDKNQEKTEKKRLSMSLIRKDILALDVKKLDPPKRNIFGLRYIGYVKSGQKITALILFEGEALAVDVGEEIAEDVSISKITLENITMIGPDQEPRTFPLEGETP